MTEAFALLERNSGPVLEDFVLADDEQTLDAANQTMGRGCGPKGCSLDDILAGVAPDQGAPTSVIRRYDGNLAAVKTEIQGLQAAHQQYRRNNSNRTQVGSSGVTPQTVISAAETVHAFVTGNSVTPPADGTGHPMSTALFVRLSVDDLKAYYMESRSEMNGGKTLDAADANDWFWLETRTGELIIAARDRIVETTDQSKDPNWILARSIVPRGYGASGYTMTHIKTGGDVQKV